MSRPKWREVLNKERPLLLPAAHDALTARLIAQTGFIAFQIGGFALDGARYGVPDMDLTHLQEKSQAVDEIMHANELPVLVDADDGYGDSKNITHMVRRYENLGVSALFIEDQQAPKRCGHMSGKSVVPADIMIEKIKAASAARHDRDAVFLIARTDARDPYGLREAMKRCHYYLKAGADGIYIEGPENRKELEAIGKEFRGVPIAADILEGGGSTPWFPPEEMGAMGFSMLLYPTSILFQVTHTLQRALTNIRSGLPMPQAEAVNMERFEKIVGMDEWKKIEEDFPILEKQQPKMLRLKNSLKKLFGKAA